MQGEAVSGFARRGCLFGKRELPSGLCPASVARSEEIRVQSGDSAPRFPTFCRIHLGCGWMEGKGGLAGFETFPCEQTMRAD